MKKFTSVMADQKQSKMFGKQQSTDKSLKLRKFRSVMGPAPAIEGGCSDDEDDKDECVHKIRSKY